MVVIQENKTFFLALGYTYPLVWGKKNLHLLSAK